MSLLPLPLDQSLQSRLDLLDFGQFYLSISNNAPLFAIQSDVGKLVSFIFSKN